MTSTHGNSWLKKAHRWFDARPGREFRLTEVPIAALPAITKAGAIAGCASAPCKPGRAVVPCAQPGATHVLCILRRADAASGRHKLGVYLLDGAYLPPPSSTAGAEEQFCETIWGVAQVAESKGLSLVALMMDPAMLARAAAALQPRRTRRP